MQKLQIDFSTLNKIELAKLPVYTKPQSYKISNSMGSDEMETTLTLCVMNIEDGAGRIGGELAEQLDRHHHG